MSAARRDWEKAYQLLETEISSAAVAQEGDLESLEKWRVHFLGRKGTLTALLKTLKDLSLEDRRALGPKAQELKENLEKDLNSRQQALQEVHDSKTLSQNAMDPTLPGRPIWKGRQHLLTQTMREMTDILRRLGFSLAQGPQIETEHYNFNALNIPADHPSRDMLDTLYLQGSSLLLRTHTSPVQIRALESQKPPLRVIAPGRVFRHEATDATHSAVFHQIEGLAVDKNISFADLKAVLQVFLKSLFGSSTRLRLRPSYFPFTEPSAEVDISCFACDGKGCGLCKQSGFIEILGSGVVHPNVLKAVGYDPQVWSGFAFGIGVERVAMLRSRVKDIRSFYENLLSLA